MAKRKQLFQFNLLPVKSQVEVAIEAERDDSLVYSIVLVAFALIAFFALTLSESLLIAPRLETGKQAIADRKLLITSFTPIRTQNGELFIKGETLEAILARDLETQEIFRVANEIKSVDPSVNVIGYSRENSGLFVFDFVTNDLDLVVKLLTKAKEVDGARDVRIRDVIIDNKGLVIVVTEMNIRGIENT